MRARRKKQSDGMPQLCGLWVQFQLATLSHINKIITADVEKSKNFYEALFTERKNLGGQIMLTAEIIQNLENPPL